MLDRECACESLSCPSMITVSRRLSLVVTFVCLGLVACHHVPGTRGGQPQRADIVSALSEMITSDPSTNPSDACAGAALFGGRDGIASFLETAPSDKSNPADDPTPEQLTIMKRHGVSAEQLKKALTEDGGKVSHEGALIIADAMMSTCASG